MNAFLPAETVTHQPEVLQHPTQEASAVCHPRYVNLGHFSEVQEGHQQSTVMQELWRRQNMAIHIAVSYSFYQKSFTANILLLNGSVMAVTAGRGPVTEMVHV
jgi:hypothetical protein